MSEMTFFDHTTGTTATMTWEARQQHLLRCETGLRRIWEETGCFRTEDAVEVAAACHELAHKALGLAP